MIPFAFWLNRLEQLPWFRLMHRWVVPRARLIVKLIQVYAAFALLPGLIGAWVMWMRGPTSYYPFFDTLGRWSGQAALVLYSLTLVPGMLRRFGIFPLTRSVLMIWRRYFGISMFHSAITHSLLLYVIPVLATDPSLLFRSPGNHVLYGLGGILLLFPLWLTSNDWSVKTMGKFWHTIHALTYIALFFIFLHVYLATSGWTKATVGIVFVLEVLSWVVRWFQRPAAATPVPAGGTPPTTPATPAPPRQ